MCGDEYCLLRGAELQIVIIIACFGLWLFDQLALINEWYLSVPPPPKLTEGERKIKCFREFLWWIHLILLLAINLSVRIYPKRFTVMALSSVMYTFLVFSGLIFWWLLRQSGYDHLGQAALAFLGFWLTSALLVITHLCTMVTLTRKLRNELPEPV